MLKQENISTYDAGISKDDPNSLLNSLKKAFSNSDVLVTTGGVSMGERDLLRPVLESDFGATIHFAQVQNFQLYLFNLFITSILYAYNNFGNGKDEKNLCTFPLINRPMLLEQLYQE